MGNCLCRPAVNDSWPPRSEGPPSPYKAGKNAHDSVHSLDTVGVKDTPVCSSKHHRDGANSSSRTKKSAFGRTKSRDKAQQHADSSQAPGSAANSSSAKKRKPPGFDIATGKPIPDFCVNGVYDVLHELGSGGSGTTYLCRDLDSGKLVAVKFVPRPLPKAAVPLMMAEVELQAQLGEGHVCIITMRELLLTRSHLALAMDYASGGALTHRVSELWETALQRGGLHMCEQEACYLLRQFVHATHYLHSHKVAHRDLKLDNTLLEDSTGRLPRIRICDFGFAKSWDTSDNMKTAIGTPVYMSPQMLAAKQCASGYSGMKADMWAAGVLLFVMLLGAFPFDHAENLDPNSRQASNEVWLRQQAPGGWRRHPLAAEALAKQRLSPDCCDLLDGLLEMDEERRLTSSEVLVHPWLHQTLLPDQQAAWEELQAEQQQVTQDLALNSDAYKVRLRKQALTAMLAFAAKPPGRTTLLQQPSAALSPQPSFINSNTATTPSAAAAAAAGAAAMPAPAGAAPAAAAGAAAAAGVPPAVINDDKVSKGSSPGPAPSSPLTVPAHRADSVPDHLTHKMDSTPDSAAAVAPTTAAAAAAEAPAGSTNAAAAAAAAAVAEAPAGAAIAAAAAAAADEAAAPPCAAVTDVEAFRADSASLPASADRTQHMSFKAGEGMRSDSLEAKVEAYRQQLADVRAARIAAATSEQQQQGAPEEAAAPAAAPSPPPKAPSPFATANGQAAGAAAAPACQPPQQQQRLSPVPSAASPTPTSSRSNSKTPSQQGSGKLGGGSGSRFKSIFAFAAKAGSGAAGRDDAAEDDEWDDTPDEVWRIPLTSTADPAAYKLSPELSLAAGALVSQLQNNGRVKGRGKTSRSSCPVY